MDFFLGSCPDKECIPQIKKVVGEIGHIFNDLNIPVRWADPQSYHIHILSLGKTMPFFRYHWIMYKLKSFTFKPFKVVFGTVKLGTNKRYKELVYLDLKEGGDSMRELLLSIRKTLGIKDEASFIPHLVLGRVSKDLSNQEALNISKDIYRVAKKLNIDKIEYYLNGITLMKHSSGGFSILLELNRTH